MGSKVLFHPFTVNYQIALSLFAVPLEKKNNNKDNDNNSGQTFRAEIGRKNNNKRKQKKNMLPAFMG